jgi:thiol:disulfide interchange protein
MAFRLPPLRPALALAALALLTAAGLRAEPEYPKMGPDIYDIHADGSADIAAALARAGSDRKRVLLVFGANWCIWCHRLHSTFETNAAVAAALEKGFVLVDVDVNTRKGEKRNAAVNERYGNPVQHGIPVLVVLDSDGKQLTTKDSGELEDGEGHSPAKILAFLAAWAPPERP